MTGPTCITYMVTIDYGDKTCLNKYVGQNMLIILLQVFVSRGSDSVFWSMMFLMLGGVQFMTNFISVSYVIQY